MASTDSIEEIRKKIEIPNAPSQEISQHLILQPPLSRRGHGPGLILVVDHYAPLGESETSIDPPPLVKWAEEGFAVCQVMVPGKVEEGGEFPLQRAVDLLRKCEECDTTEEEGFGLISYLTRVPFYIEESAILSPHITAIVSFASRVFSTLNSDATTIPPQLLHIAGPESSAPPRRRASLSYSSTSNPPPTGPVKIHYYPSASKDSSWILPGSPDYHSSSATLAHTRSLQFLKKHLGGPLFDLEAIWDEHCLHEFSTRDVAATMSTMVARPYVNHIPTMTGGIGQSALTSFYASHFIHSNPPDTAMDLVSRTVGTDRIVDEFVFKLTHDRQVEWLLPGVPPTGKYIEVPFTSVVQVRGDRLCHEHIHWDQGTVLRQVGLLPEWVKFDGEIEGKKAVEGKRWEVKLPVVGAEGARKLVDEGSEESNALMGRGWREVDDK